MADKKISDAFQRNQSSASIFYEQIVQEYQREELAQLATLDQMTAGDGKKKKKQGGMNAAVASTEKIRTWNEHMLDVEDLAKQLDTKIHLNPGDAAYYGLTDLQGSEKLAHYGKNALSEKKQLPCIVRFLLTMTGLFNYVIIIGSVLCFIVFGIQKDKTDKSNLYLAVVLLFVILITAIFNFQQQSKASAIMAGFKNFIPAKALVWRNGEKNFINASTLVPGDIVEVNFGDNIPADMVIIKANEMKVNNSSLTGESEELPRIPEEKSKNIFESHNVAFFGTMCTAGSGTGIVFKTGDNTVIGQIANLAQSADQVETPIARELDHFIYIVAGIAISSGIIFFLIDFIYGYSIINNVSYCIGIIVANVPEGLLITVTVCMALAAQRMAQRRVLVKNLQSVETLGSTSCICSDKTGTLTQNKMTASHMFFDGKIIDVSVNYEEKIRKNADIPYEASLEEPGFKALVQCVALGSKATFSYKPTPEEIKTFLAQKRGVKVSTLENAKLTKEEEDEGTAGLLDFEAKLPISERKCAGDASETGLIKFVQPLLDIEQARGAYPTFQYTTADGKLNECFIPFSSEIKFNLNIRDMNTQVKKPQNKDDNFMIVMKGAPERILKRCTKILINDEERDFDAYWQTQVNKANDKFGKMGERVLAFAQIKLDPKVYPKDPAYEFDVKNWKKWMDVQNRDENIKGWFPMYGLTLVGIVSLNDPPRPSVAYSVQTCKQAGIKVIMVTGDQPPTAASIAHKVNIITDPSLEYNTMVRKGMSTEEAWSKCKAIVIHGDLLAEKHANEDNLDDMDPEKGRFLIDWIKKPEVVFARTTPSQKLLIVDACQRAGHIVAVTGDGVNDSPAIKKADIGIAMGSGSDVAKNDADILLLDDDFSAIVAGVEQGRIMFDNLKKSISYALAVNMAELFPVLFYILFQIPVPLSSILMLVICVGTDMAPAISLAYENGELDIMERMPRNAKLDHLVTVKLIGFSYMQIGIMEFIAGMFTYFYVLNDYGFPFVTLVNLNGQYGYYPLESDVYSPNEPNQGNSNFGNSGSYNQISWGTIVDNKMDARLFLTGYRQSDFSRCRWNPLDTSIPKWWRISPLSDTQICYTPEALQYAQSAYFIACICVQWANVIICKTRTLSLAQQQFVNNQLILGIAIETACGIITSYIYQIGIGIYTRAVAPSHFVVPAMAYFTIIMFYDETRKVFLRRGIRRDGGKVKYTGWVARNTFY